MSVPLVCFISYNRLGVAAYNLQELLKTEDDFELIIVDNASSDGMWEYIETLKDSRIIEKKHFEKNYGVIYAINYGLSRRKKDQAFVHIENDLYIADKHWVSKLQKTSEVFPELGLIAVIPERNFLETIKGLGRTEEENKELLLEHNKSKLVFVPEVREGIEVYYNHKFMGCCNYLTPQVIEKIGYWNEEICGADMEIGKRISMYTPYYVGMVTDFFAVLHQVITCKECPAQKFCPFARKTSCDCYVAYIDKRGHADFAAKENLAQKVQQYLIDIGKGERSVYSASIHDEESRKLHPYDIEAAMKNFEFFNHYGQNKK